LRHHTEVYLTGPRAVGDVREEELSGAAPAFEPTYPHFAGDGASQPPPPFGHPFTFIHGKYCVADRRRCSAGAYTRPHVCST